MSKVITVHDAKTHFSKYLERAVRGEEIRIGKYGKPMVKLVPDKPRAGKRIPGALAGKGYWIAGDFDATPQEITETLEQTFDDDLA